MGTRRSELRLGSGLPLRCGGERWFGSSGSGAGGPGGVPEAFAFEGSEDGAVLLLELVEALCERFAVGGLPGLGDAFGFVEGGGVSLLCLGFSG